MKKMLWLLSASVFCGSVSADTLFVTLEKANAMAIVNGASAKLEKTIKLGARPRGIVLNPDFS